MMGLSLRNVTLTVRRAGKKKPVFSELGEMLFTHFGVSGPLVLSASSHMTGDLGEYSMEIDLKPGLTVQQLDARLLRDFEEVHQPGLCQCPGRAAAPEADPGGSAAFGHCAGYQGQPDHPGGTGKADLRSSRHFR